MSTNLSLRFESVLRRLDYERRLRQTDRRLMELRVPDAVELLGEYASSMNLGVRFDIAINQPWNLDSPHSFTRQNVDTARLIHAQSKDLNSSMERIYGVPVPGLSDIPLDQDLFTTDHFDAAAATALAFLDDLPGIGAANASKLLHQKRPGMFPIFDVLARRALNIPFVDGRGPKSFLPLLQRYRRFRDIHMNRAALSELCVRLRETDTNHFSGKSLVRIVDGLAWSVINFRDPFLKVV